VDNDITLSNVLDSTVVLSNSHIDTAISLGNCQICSFYFPVSQGGFDKLEEYKDVLAYAQEKDIRVYSAIHYEDVDIDELLQYGIMGAQLAIVPNFD
jgi:hypothetical protein